MKHRKKSGRTSKRVPTPAPKGPQIKNLAVNLFGWAMGDGIEGRPCYETITARPACSTLYSSILSRNNDKQPIFRSSLDFSKTELAPPINGNSRYLIVGYATRAITEGEHLKKNKPYDKGKPMSIGQYRPHNVIPWDSGAPPILVVTEIPAREGEGIHFWALLWPKKDLCTPFTIKVESVFFRWEFRSPRNTKSRKDVWVKSIADAVDALSRSSFSASTDPIPNRILAPGPISPEGEKPRRVAASLQSSLKKNFGEGDRQEEVSFTKGFGTAFQSRNLRQVFAAPRIEAAINNSHFKVSSSPSILSSYLPSNSAQADGTVSDEEPLAPETLQTARELHQIAQRSLKAERDKLDAESFDSSAKEAILNKWQAALSQEKTAFQQGITIQERKLTERENLVQTLEQRAHEREQHLQARENTVKEKEERAEKTEKKLRGWEAILIGRGKVFIEREGRYHEGQAKISADEKMLRDREAAVLEDQNALESWISNSIKSLQDVQQSWKRKVDDIGDGRKLKKHCDGTGH